MQAPCHPYPPLQTSTSVHHCLSHAVLASAALTRWDPTHARGTHCSADVATKPARMEPNVWVRPDSSLPPYPQPALAFLSSWPVGVPCRGRAWASGCLSYLPLADVNECEAGMHHCKEGQVCHNLPGSYRCDCKAGFQQDAFGRACVGRWKLVAKTLIQLP